jgi:sigma-B regulation protein RsbU (phosphoserine phosphatase)
MPDSMPAAVAQAVAAAAGERGAEPPELPPLPEGAQPLVQAVVGTNRYLARNHLEQGYFATMFFAVLDPQTGAVLYINGGHNPPVLRRADGSVTMLMPTGPAVGMLADSEFSLGHLLMEPGDVLFAYSDGVVEARNLEDRLFGTEAMVELVTADGSAADVVQRVDEAVRAFVGNADQSDDITMMALRRSRLS